MRNIVHTLLYQCGIRNKSSFYQCRTECTFSFKNGYNTEAVPSVLSIFLKYYQHVT
jgi:hypothetical protein